MDDNQVPEQVQEKNSLKKQLTTVTPLSKYLAMVLFIALPFVGFWFGLNYSNEATEQAIKNAPEVSLDECSNLDAGYKNICYLELAISFNDVSYCDNAEDIQDIDGTYDCISNFAIKANNPAICEVFLSEYAASPDSCYFTYAKKNMDLEECKKINEITLKNRCFEAIALNSESPEACSYSEGEDSMKECIENNVFEYNRCNEATNQATKDYCIMWTAETLDRCEEVANKEYKDECTYLRAMADRNCDAIVDSEDKKICEHWLSLKSDCKAGSFQNEIFNYKLEYPCGWLVDDENSYSDFEKRGDDGALMGGDTYWENYHWRADEPSAAPDDHHSLYLIIYRVNDSDKLSIDDYFLEPYEKYAPQDVKSSEDFVTNSGVKGRTYLTENSDHPVGVKTIRTVFKLGSDFYRFRSPWRSKEFHNEILATFEFIN